MGYEIVPLKEQHFRLSDELIAYASDTEIEYAHTDERSVRYPYGSSLRNSLARLEAICTGSIRGVMPDLETMCWLRAMSILDNVGSIKPGSSPFFAGEASTRAAAEASRYQEIIEGIANLPVGCEVNERDFLLRHAYLAHGNFRLDDVRYRSRPFLHRRARNSGKNDESQPPAPEAIPALMNDLFEFVKTPVLTPCCQAAIAHFQLQAICPFKTSMDYTDRTLALWIMRKRGFFHHIIPCIGSPLASNFERYVHLLMPYRFSRDIDFQDLDTAYERWIRCCIDDLKQTVRIVKLYMDGVKNIIDSYQAHVGPYKKGSTLDVLMRELPGLPVVDARVVGELTGKGFTASTEAITRLTNAGVLRQVGKDRRNRWYEATEIVENEQMVLDLFLPPAAVNRVEPNL